MTASRIIGDYMGDLIGEDEAEIADLVGDLELGRRLRGGRRRRALRGARRLGITDVNAARQALRREQLQSLDAQAAADGDQLTAGHYVADSGQRKLYLPFASEVALAAAAGSVAQLTATVQRPMSIARLILDSLNATTLADDLNTVVVTGVNIGVQPVFNAVGAAPATAFRQNTVGNQLETMVARVGTIITVAVRRSVATANAGSVSGYLVGVSAEH